jgi:transposase
MNTLQIASTVLSMLCLVITTVLAWVMLNKTNKTEVTFTGTPVDKKEFERHQRENREEHEKIFAKLDATQDRINPIEGDIRALCEASEIHTTRLVQMEGKIDRLIERL